MDELKNKENQLIELLQELGLIGIEEGVFPGVASGVYIQGEEQSVASYFYGGQTRIGDDFSPIDGDVVFDLASLTKPLSTVLLILKLVEAEQLQLSDSLGRFFPEIAEDKKYIQIHHLLSHSSGLPAYREYFAAFEPVVRAGGTDELIDCILTEPLEYETGVKCIYSDLGYILLGDIIEKCAGMSLDSFFLSKVSNPLGLSKDLFFCRENGMGMGQKIHFAATEACHWRKRIIQAEVHDEHCWLMGGVAGHAGLFGTVKGVMSLCRILLDIYQGRSTFIQPDLLRMAFSKVYSDQSWCLGFDSPTPGKSSSGKYFSPNSVGHLGYAGTSFWVDTEKKIIVVLLTNRVHPSRENKKIQQFRPLFHDRIMEWI